nr:hypothetical protein [Streptomyces yokosukanensis]
MLGAGLGGVHRERRSSPEAVSRRSATSLASCSACSCAVCTVRFLYYAHELQRHAGPGVDVTVYEPGWMPGTDLGRGAPAVLRAIGRGIAHLPRVATPERSGPALASVALDEKWAHLRDGAFVVRDKVTEVRPVAQDRDRERRLWQATAQLLANAHV